MTYKVYVPEYGSRMYSKMVDGDIITYNITLPNFTIPLLVLVLDQKTNRYTINTTSPKSIDTLNNLYALMNFFEEDFTKAVFLNSEIDLGDNDG